MFQIIMFKVQMRFEFKLIGSRLTSSILLP
jgi:hypothetical protein